MTPRLPLDGIRVIDLGHYIADPFATRILADYGAEVIKVETTRRPDMTRKIPPFAGGRADPNRAGWFLNANYNKLGLTLNLVKPEAREILLRLVAISDIVTENFSAGVLDRLGLGYDTLRAVRPDIILIQMPGFGRSGPYQDLRAVGPTVAAFSGIDATIGWPDGPPLPTGRVPVPDYINGLGGAIALLAALEHRAKTGQGQAIELSQHENTVATQGPALLQAQATGRWPVRNGNRDAFAAPQGVFRCTGEDAWCAISIRHDDDWRAFCAVAGRPDLAADPRYAVDAGRRAHPIELEAALAEFCGDRTPHQVMTSLQAAGVPAGAVLNGRGMTEDEQLATRGYFVQFDRPDTGPIAVSGTAAIFSETPGTVRHPAPCLGESNGYILGDLLGLSATEIAALQAAEIIV